MADMGSRFGVHSGYGDPRFWAKTAPDGDCLLFMGSRDPQGYGHVLRKSIRKAPMQAHRYAWILANGPIPDGAVIRHTCDRPSCVNPAHLLIGTQADNIDDRQRRGRHRPGRLSGEDHPAHKLTADEVRYIREQYARFGRRELARRFGVSHDTVYRAATGRSWGRLAA